MNLISLALYDSSGERVVIDFHTGLNIVTGVSGTGKSALLDMVEYCLGRDTLIMPVGPITDTVTWYGLLVSLPNTRAFVGRPAPASGRASSSQAMLEFGTLLELPAFDDLHVNSDTKSVRSQIGRSLGIDENVTEPSSNLQQGFEANLGHATLFCLQRQSEIANREQLFHRQGEEGMARAIQATLPYFLGAVPRDRAVLQQQLNAARRALRSAEAELRRAEAADEQLEVSLRSLLTEGSAIGLIDGDIPSGTEDAFTALRRMAIAPVAELALDDEEQRRRVELVRRRGDLRQQLRQLGEERAILDTLQVDEAQYDGTVGRQVARLHSLDLLGDNEGSVAECPICGSHLAEEDPSIDELRQAAEELQVQVGRYALAQPRRTQALADLSDRTTELRDELRGVDEAISAIEAARQAVDAGRQFAERQAFLQGRIQQFLDTSEAADSPTLELLRQTVALRQAAVDELESQLDPDEEREQLMSRLSAVGRDMTTWADALGLEHSGTSVRLDLSRLTVVADTASGPAALNRIGSGANWIGYHIVAHLALHKFFTEQDRPVPRFLMLDQPTQAYYPSDVDRESGVPDSDDDRAAVLAMFDLMRQVVENLEDQFQVIVCDHANLAEDWFQDAVVANWRDGERLIPDAWISE